MHSHSFFKLSNKMAYQFEKMSCCFLLSNYVMAVYMHWCKCIYVCMFTSVSFYGWISLGLISLLAILYIFL